MQASSLEGLLRDRFGLESFRESQKEVCETVINGKDALLILPTGGGKSLCYQLPAFARGGVVIVISPLIALMRDQVRRARALGLHAVEFHSYVPRAEKDAARSMLTAPQWAPQPTLLFSTPETVTSVESDFIRTLHSLGRLCLIAIDEAHCISTWGHDFRPTYRLLGSWRASLPGVPCLAMTATATRAVTNDIRTTLCMSREAVFRSSFDRANLAFLVLYRKGCKSLVSAAEKVLQQVHIYPSAVAGGGPSPHVADGDAPGTSAGIIYCATRADAEEVTQALMDRKFAIRAYHAGLGDRVRSEVQSWWRNTSGAVVAATCAFGMGIDHPHVRAVIHWTAPRSVEAFYQEAGRAGRDGRPAVSLLCYDRSDLDRLKFLSQREIRMKSARGKDSRLLEAEAERAEEALRALQKLCESPTCRRQAILRHFGETRKQACPRAAMCDICRDPAGARQRVKEGIHGKRARGGAGQRPGILTGSALLRSLAPDQLEVGSASPRRSRKRPRESDGSEDEEEAEDGIARPRTLSDRMDAFPTARMVRAQKLRRVLGNGFRYEEGGDLPPALSPPAAPSLPQHRSTNDQSGVSGDVRTRVFNKFRGALTTNWRRCTGSSDWSRLDSVARALEDVCFRSARRCAKAQGPEAAAKRYSARFESKLAAIATFTARGRRVDGEIPATRPPG